MLASGSSPQLKWSSLWHDDDSKDCVKTRTSLLTSLPTHTYPGRSGGLLLLLVLSLLLAPALLLLLLLPLLLLLALLLRFLPLLLLFSTASAVSFYVHSVLREHMFSASSALQP